MLTDRAGNVLYAAKRQSLMITCDTIVMSELGGRPNNLSDQRQCIQFVEPSRWHVSTIDRKSTIFYIQSLAAKFQREEPLFLKVSETAFEHSVG